MVCNQPLNREKDLAFPILFNFNIRSEKDASLADNWQLFTGSPQWEVAFDRAVQDWEMDYFISFYAWLYSLRVFQGKEDKMC